LAVWRFLAAARVAAAVQRWRFAVVLVLHRRCFLAGECDFALALATGANTSGRAAKSTARRRRFILSLRIGGLAERHREGPLNGLSTREWRVFTPELGGASPQMCHGALPLYRMLGHGSRPALGGRTRERSPLAASDRSKGRKKERPAGR
jgi:hypothetical protein